MADREENFFITSDFDKPNMLNPVLIKKRNPKVSLHNIIFYFVKYYLIFLKLLICSFQVLKLNY